MSLGIGIIGLPNVGKSTLFNALLKKQQALAANYPFATIEPNIGVVPVPDERLVRLAEITKEEEGMANLPPIKPATVEFVDIAGLVKAQAKVQVLVINFFPTSAKFKLLPTLSELLKMMTLSVRGALMFYRIIKRLKQSLFFQIYKLLKTQKAKIKRQKFKAKIKMNY